MAVVESAMRRDLAIDELALLEEVVARRDPEMAPLVERLAELTPEQRERFRRLLVDELCELPESAQREKLALEELLIRLGPD